MNPRTQRRKHNNTRDVIVRKGDEMDLPKLYAAVVAKRPELDK